MSENPHQRSQADSSALYSGAQSFLSFLEKGVDPRTGTYSIRIAMPEIAINAMSGPDVALSLSFNPMQNVDLGVGRGWSWGTSQFSPLGKRLILSSGETHLALLTETGIEFPDRKLSTFKVERLENALLITYRSGRRERLVRFNLSDPLSPYVPEEITSPQGHAMRLTWTPFEGKPSLSTITDHDGRELLRVSRTDLAATISVATSEGGMAAFSLNLSGDLVSSIALPVTENAAWQLRYAPYTDANLAFLTEVKSPTGSVESIVYKEAGHAMPLRATDPPGEPARVPYVERYVMDPGGGQPRRISTYSYSTRNYFGFEAGVHWEDSTDALYKVLTDYRYDCTESQLDADGNPLITIYRQYDRFHALRIERRTQGDCEEETLDDFHDEPGKSWYEQSPIVELVSRHRVRYTRDGVSREVVSTYRYDEWGNEVESIGPDGIAERTTYYDPAGEPGCPPDPIWLTPRKEKTVTREPAEPDERVVPTTVTYIYGLMSSIDPTAPQYLHCTEQRQSTADGDFATITFDYEDNPQSPLLHGRLRGKTETVNGLTTFTQFAYDVVGNELIIDESAHTDFDDTATHAAVHRSVFSGLELRRENADERVTYQHDAMGRVTRETAMPVNGDRVYEAWVEHTYAFPAQAGGTVSHATRNASGVVITQHFDGTGLLVRETKLSPEMDGQTHHDVRLVTYDEFGRAVREIQRDVVDGEVIANTLNFFFDDWGQRNRVVRSDGVTEHVDFSPVSLVETSWVSSGSVVSGKQVRLSNRFDEIERDERLLIDGTLVSRTTMTYDGMGRQTSVTELGTGTTRYAYDFADRLVSETLPDDTVVTYDYAPHSLTDALTAVRVDGISVGEREFDGLLRVVSQTVGAQRSTWAFDGDRSHPREERTPTGDVLGYEVNPSLTTRMRKRTAGPLEMSYEYDPQSGLLLKASSQGPGQTPIDYACERDSVGNLLKETWTDAESSHSAEHAWTLMGRPDRYTDATGKVHRYLYDKDTSRLKEVQCDDVSVAFAYDSLGRLSEQRMTQAGDDRLTVTLSYDDIGREIHREFVAPTHPVFSISQEYDGFDRLIARTRSSGGNKELEENFSYDERSRLNLYYATGANAPADPHDPAQHIQVQQWEYDKLDNITRISTWHQGPDKPPAIATYHYDNDADPTQLTSLDRSDYGAASGTQTFRYDDAGRMIEAEDGYHVVYDAFDHVVSISRNNVERAAYRYNGMDEQSHVTVPSQPVRKRIFREHKLVTEIRGALSRTYLPGGLGDLDETGALRVYVTDQKSTVLQGFDAQGQRHDAVYSPSGYRAQAAWHDGVPGQDGEIADPATQWLWLGNTRMYSPVLARFLVPDSYSPFDGGGINRYARIDPVNSIDPSGHIPKWLAIGIAVVMATIAIATAVFVPGGFGAVGIAAKVTAKAVAGKLGVISATSAKAMAIYSNVKVTASVFATIKFGLSVAGTLSTMTSTIARTLDPESQLAVTLGHIGSALTVAAFFASIPGFKAVNKGFTDKVAEAQKGGKANAKLKAIAKRDERKAARAAKKSNTNRNPGSTRSAGRPQTPSSTARDAGPSGSPDTQSLAQAEGQASAGDYALMAGEQAVNVGANVNNYLAPQPIMPTGGGLPQPRPMPLMMVAEDIRLMNKNYLNYFNPYGSGPIQFSA